MRDAGAVVLGKTNVAQLLLFTRATTRSTVARTIPGTLERSPGGSSGGEGAISRRAARRSASAPTSAAVSACPRPSAASRLKPTAGRLPDMGRFSVPIGQRAIVSQVGLLAAPSTTWRLASMSCRRVTAGRRWRRRCHSEDWAVDVRKLRVGTFIDDGVMTPAPACRRAVEEAASMLAAAGATIVPWQPPPVAIALAIWLGCMSADGGRGMKRLVRGEEVDKRAALFLSLSAMPQALRSIVAPLLEFFWAAADGRHAAPVRAG